MKKLTKKLTLVLVSVLVVMLCVGIMFACEPQDKEPDHTHSYSGDWKSDKDNHWKECSCGDKSEVAAHASNDGDEICDICGYNMHVHSYSNDWSKDATNHWHECSCGAKSDESAHVDAIDADGNDAKDEKCDICGYDMHEHKCVWLNDSTGHWQKCTGCNEEFTKTNHVDEKDADGNAGQDEICDICGYNMHVHDYAAAWSKDATNHWHECSCGAKSDEAAHVDAKDADGNDGHDGKCDACGWDGSFTVTVKDSKGNGIKDVELEINEVVAKTDENGIATFNMFVPDHELIYFNDYPSNYYKNASYYTELGTSSYEITLISEITNTFEIVDQKTSSPIANVTLKLMDGETVAASGETDSEGKVTLTYAVGEGKYYYAIEGLTAAQYLSKNAGISKNHVPDEDSKVTTITVYSYATYTITVKCDEGVEHTLEDLTVKVDKYTGTTNASGVAEIYAPAASSLYTVSVSGLEDGFEAEDGEVGYDWWEMTTTYETTLTIKAKSEGGDEGGGSTSGNALALGTNTVEATGNGTAYTLTAGEAGDYTISSEDSNCCVMDSTGEIEYILGANSYTFNLSAGETITVYFATYDYSDSDSYDVTVSYAAGATVVSIPDGFIGNWIDENNVVYTITSSLVMDDCLNIYKVGEKVEVISNTEIKVDGLTWTLTKDGRILITAEDMDPIYLAVKYPTLYEGNNTVDASYDGEGYEFTADVAGTYIISTESDIAYISISTGNEIKGAGSVSIALEKDQNILIIFMIQEEGEDAKYDVNISQVYPSIEEGTHTITTDANGKKYTLTATEAGTYTISCESAYCFITEKNYLFDYIMEGGSTSIALEVGDKITICFYTADDQEHTYDVTISYSETVEGGGDQGGDEDLSITFPENLRDTWYADINGDIIEIVISEHSIAMGDIDGSAYSTEEDETLGTLYKFSIEGWEYFIYSDGTDWYLAQRQRNDIVSYKLYYTMPEA